MSGLLEHVRVRLLDDSLGPGPVYNPGSGIGAGANSSQVATFITIVLSAIGAGVLSFPFAFHNAGILTGFIITLLSTALLIYFAKQIGIATTKFSPRMRAGTYEELMRVAVGQWAYLLAIAAIVLLSLGALVGFFVVIVDICRPVLLHYSSSSILHSRVFIILVFAYVVALPLSFFPQLHHLFYASLLGVVSVILVVGGIWFRGIQALAKSGGSWPHPVHAVYNSGHSNLGIFVALPICLFALSCTLQLVPAYVELRGDLKPKFPRLAALCFIFVSVVYALTGVLGYAYAGKHVKGDVLDAFPVTDVLMSIARFTMAIHIALASPVVIYPCRAAIAAILNRMRTERASAHKLLVDDASSVNSNDVPLGRRSAGGAHVVASPAASDLDAGKVKGEGAGSNVASNADVHTNSNATVGTGNGVDGVGEDEGMTLWTAEHGLVDAITSPKPGSSSSSSPSAPSSSPHPSASSSSSAGSAEAGHGNGGESALALLPFWMNATMSVVLIGFCSTLAIVMPGIDTVFGLIGSTAVPVICIILPAFLDYSVRFFTYADVLHYDDPLLADSAASLVAGAVDAGRGTAKAAPATSASGAVLAPGSDAAVAGEDRFASLQSRIRWGKDKDTARMVGLGLLGIAISGIATGMTVYTNWFEKKKKE